MLLASGFLQGSPHEHLRQMTTVLGRGVEVGRRLGPLGGGPGGERTIGASDFFTGFLETALGPDELLTEIRVPKVAGAGWSYQKFNRRALDWAIVGVAAVKNGTTGVALVNMGPTPLRASAVEQALSQGASIQEAARAAAEGTEPPADLNASPEYRRHLAQVLVRRALEEAGG